MTLPELSRSRASHDHASVWWQPAILVLLTAWLYAPIASRLIEEWWHDPDYMYGFVVPAFALFLVWESRSRLAALTPKPSWWGLSILLFALLALAVGAASSEFFLPRISLLLLITGVVLFFGGWSYLRVIVFPLIFLVLMIPSTTIYNHLTLPLQLLASKAACALLNLLAIPAAREGNIILLPAAQMEVAEACSGIRSLFTLITLAIIYGHLCEKRNGLRVLLVLAAVPVAVVANILRVTATGIFVQRWGVRAAEGTVHLLSGWLIFVVCLAMIFGFHAILKRLLTNRQEAATQGVA